MGFEFERYTRFTTTTPDIPGWTTDARVRLVEVLREAGHARAGRDAWLNGGPAFETPSGAPARGSTEAFYLRADPGRPHKIALARSIMAVDAAVRGGSFERLDKAVVRDACGSNWTRVVQYAMSACPFGHALEGFATFLIADGLLTSPEFVTRFEAGEYESRMRILVDLMVLMTETEAGRAHLTGGALKDTLLDPVRLAGLLDEFDLRGTPEALRLIASGAPEGSKSATFAARAKDPVIRLYLEYAGAIAAVPDTDDLSRPGPIYTSFQTKLPAWQGLRGLAKSSSLSQAAMAYTLAVGAMKGRVAATTLGAGGTTLTDAQREAALIDMLAGMGEVAAATQAILERNAAAFKTSSRLAKAAAIAGRTSVKGALSVFGIVMGGVDTYRAFAAIDMTGENIGLTVGLGVKAVGAAGLLASSVLLLLAPKFAALGPPGWIAFVAGIGLTITGELIVTVYEAGKLEGRIKAVIRGCALSPPEALPRLDAVIDPMTVNPRVDHPANGFARRVGGQVIEDWGRQIGTIHGLVSGIGFSMEVDGDEVRLDSVRKMASAYVPPAAIMTDRPRAVDGTELPDSYFLPPETRVTLYDVTPGQPDAHRFNLAFGPDAVRGMSPVEVDRLPSGEAHFHAIQGMIERPIGTRIPATTKSRQVAFPGAAECRTTTARPLLATSPLAALLDGVRSTTAPEMLTLVERAPAA